MGRVYDLAAWAEARLLHLAEEPLCRACRQRGIVTVAAHVDHIIPISKGGAWFDCDNLQSLCEQCHSKKTVTDTGRSVAPVVPKFGCDARGIPVDRTHPWNQKGK